MHVKKVEIFPFMPQSQGDYANWIKPEETNVLLFDSTTKREEI